MSIMGNNLEPGTIHVLTNRHDQSKKSFEWTGTAWSKPGTG